MSLIEMPEKLEIHIVSDSTGDTAARVARAAQSQFARLETELVRHARVTDARAARPGPGRRPPAGRAAVFYTLVDPDAA